NQRFSCPNSQQLDAVCPFNLCPFLCSDRAKGKEKEKPTSRIDEDHCDTDDDIQSGYS
ncbi:hypothetical protein MKX03_025152, partial [Papaver bracteatum]